MEDTLLAATTSVSFRTGDKENLDHSLGLQGLEELGV